MISSVPDKLLADCLPRRGQRELTVLVRAQLLVGVGHLRHDRRPDLERDPAVGLPEDSVAAHLDAVPASSADGLRKRTSAVTAW
ncbi:hypothetical protein NQK81_21320 [Amycolatopsis roodepoortensis]|uniref:hypothetical protein n=1 Tax=Amycolatopsis roodepoortensis TaxID=700274 RepID=UPI00214D0E19|nr:hypothetical protein [Amycolatopsis roodepoortensis]UUV35873.1 hypothetical protein NQK81_21320 [Amycolatopsis roodepoortensis]